jgi:hypothetical protein
MSDQVVKVDGEDVVMREDQAKQNRGMRWAIWSIVLFILVAGALFFLGVFKLATDGTDPSIRNATNTAAPAQR